MISKKKSFRQNLIATVTFLGGVYFFLQFVLPDKVAGYQFGKYFEEASNTLIVMGAVAIGLGIISLLRVHILNILKGRKGWYNSIALIVGLLATFAIEASDIFSSEQRSKELAKVTSYAKYLESLENSELNAGEKAKKVEALQKELETLSLSSSKKDFPISRSIVEEKLENKELADKLKLAIEKSIEDSSALTKSLQLGQKEKTESLFKQSIASVKNLFKASHEASDLQYQKDWPRQYAKFMFQAFYAPLGAAMFSLLAFYVATAAYRSFRIHSIEAAVMMLAALIVVLGQIPFGPLYISDKLPAIREWLMEYLNVPASRTILFGSAIASMGMSIRMWFSLEKSPLDSEGDE